MTRKEADYIAVGDKLYYKSKGQNITFTVKDIKYTTPTDMKHTKVIFVDRYDNLYIHTKCHIV